MEQSKNTIPLSVDQIFNLSTFKPPTVNESQNSEIVKSTPNTNQELIPLIEENNKFSESFSSLNEYPETIKNLKELFAQCKFCRKTFNSISDLIIHKKSHTDQKFYSHLPFKCTFCSVAFNGLKQLKKHLKTHTSKKSFKCNVCSKCFLQSESLKQHTLVKHGI